MRASILRHLLSKSRSLSRDLTARSPDLVRLYLDEAGRHPLLSAEEEYELARRAELGDEQARRKLIESNLRLVVMVASRYKCRGLSLLDLIQEGNVGLLEAVERFDRHRATRFSTYACWRIKASILSAIAGKSTTVRSPRSAQDRARNLARASRGLVEQLGREPTTHELAGHTKLSVDRVRAGLTGIVREPLSLETTLGEDGYSVLGDLIADETVTVPCMERVARDTTNGIRKAFSALTAREECLLRMKFGLAEVGELEVVGEDLDLSAENIARIEDRARRKARAARAARGARRERT